MCLCRNKILYVFLENGKSSYAKYIVSCFDYAVKVAGFMNMVGFQNHELSSHIIAVKLEYILFYAKPENSHSTETLTCL